MLIFFLNMAVFNGLGFLSEMFQRFPSLCLRVLFLTIQISLTLFKVLLSDSLLGLVKSGAEQIASCQNQPTNH